MGIVLEACVTTVAAARQAVAAGIERVELCTDLDVGGLTPEPDDVAALAADGIVVHAMARPHADGFVCSDAQLATICASIERLRLAGAAGIVAGALDGRDGIDAKATARMLDACAGLPLTFHRAFDRVADPLAAAADLARLGVARVLAAGGRGDRAGNWAALRSLVAHGQLDVIGCGGIRARSIEMFVQATGVDEVHFNAMADHGRADADLLAAMRERAAALG